MTTKWIKYCLLILLSAVYCTVNAQNVGIGTTSPAYKLDVAGRVRLQQANGQTAGIWYDGPVNSNIAFIGTYTNNTVGMYSSPAGWQFIFDINTGDFGLGTTAPTAKLDVNGDFRLRGNAPINGATLVSKDGSGNTSWQQPFAFKVSGLAGLANEAFVANSQTPIDFYSVADYNVGFAYSTGSSRFTVPVKGIYNFQVQLDTYCTNCGTSGRSIIRLARLRNNVTTIVARTEDGLYASGSVTSISNPKSKSLSVDLLLLPGDVIWVSYAPLNNFTVYGNQESTFFSGRLVTQLF